MGTWTVIFLDHFGFRSLDLTKVMHATFTLDIYYINKTYYLMNMRAELSLIAKLLGTILELHLLPVEEILVFTLLR